MNWKKPAVWVVALIALLLVVAMVLWSRTKSGAPSFLDGVKTNAYDDFVKASRLLIGSPVDADDLAEFVRTNQPAFDAFRRGLQKPFEAPAETYNLPTFSAMVMPNMASFKALAQAFRTAGEEMEKSGNYGGAAAVYVDVIQFGQKIQRGPAIMLLIGLAIEDIGMKALRGIETELKGPDRAQIAARLEKLSTERVSFEEVLKRERYFARRSSITPLHYLMALKASRPALESAEIKHERQEKAARELLDVMRQAPAEVKQP